MISQTTEIDYTFVYVQSCTVIAKMFYAAFGNLVKHMYEKRLHHYGYRFNKQPHTITILKTV